MGAWEAPGTVDDQPATLSASMTTDTRPRLISLFAGVGGFDLGFEAAGFRTVGQCEIDPHATSVLERHWPDVPKHPDVTTLRPEHFGPAEVITFGSPCQDLSVAGKRAGLAGERSGLFTAAMDYIRAMQEATDGQYPRVVVWENVPGAFSSNGGHDFAAVLESMVGGSAGVTPPAEGWPTAGVAFGPEGAVEWRVFDSQYFGVAQRRRRIFVVYHPRGDSAGQVLLEPASVRGNPNESHETRPHPTHGAADRARAGSREDHGVDRNSEHIVPVLNDQGGSRMEVSHGVTGTLRAHSKGNEPIIPAMGLSQEYDAEEELLGTLKAGSPTGGGMQPMVGVPVAFKIRGGVEVDSAGKSAGKGYLGSEDKALTLGASQDQYLAEPRPPAIGFDHAAGAQHGLSEREEISPTLQASAGIGRAAAAIPIQDGRGMLKEQNGLGIGDPDSPSYTVDTTGAQAVAYGVTSKGNGEAFLTPERHTSLTSGGGQAGQGYPAVMAPVAFAQNSRNELRLEGGDGSRAGALSTGGGKPGQGAPTIATAYSVRRLTPVECERLQGFPDNWTALGATRTEERRALNERGRALEERLQREWEESDDPTADEWPPLPEDCYDTVTVTVEEQGLADTHRYRMCGNAVTTTVAAWIARRIMRELRPQPGEPAPPDVT